jgi:hypothetical protein
VKNSKNSQVLGNTSTKAEIGILVSASDSVLLESNIVYMHSSAGIQLAEDAPYAKLYSNRVGSSSEFSDKKSKGKGLVVYSHKNIIGGSPENANFISHNALGGVEINAADSNLITFNSIFQNDTVFDVHRHFAISHINNGNRLKEAPSIDSSVTIAANHRFTVMGTAAPGDTVHLYRSEGYYQDARYFVSMAVAGSDGRWEALIDTSKLKRTVLVADSDDTNIDNFYGEPSGAVNIEPVFPQPPLRNNTFSIVATATDADANTSPLSGVFFLGTCYVCNSDDSGNNDFPLPNSLRQAVKCANSVKQKAEIKVAIELANTPVYAEIPMIPFSNELGLAFDGKSLIGLKEKLAITSANYIDTLGIDSLSTFWVLNNIPAHISIKNLEVSNFDTCFVFNSPKAVSLSGIDFKNLKPHGTSIKFPYAAAAYSFDSLNFSSSVNSSYLVFADGLKDFRITNCSFNQSNKPAVRMAGVSGFVLENNKFVMPYADTLGVVEVALSADISLNYNEFDLSPAQIGIAMRKSSGAINNNEFTSKPFTIGQNHNLPESLVVKSSLPLYLFMADTVSFSKNKFKGVAESSIKALRSSNLSLSGNSYSRSTVASVHLDRCSLVSFIAEEFQELDSLGINLIRSSQVAISACIADKFTDTEVKAISLNYGKGDKSNAEKPIPVIDRYMVAKEKDGDCKEPEERYGLYLAGTSEPGDKIEIFFTDSLKNTLNKYLKDSDAKADSSGLWETYIPRELYYKAPFNKWYHFTATATDTSGNTSELAKRFSFSNPTADFVVRNTNDSGPESLREAIENTNCSDVRAQILFQIPGSGSKTISLNDSLPVLWPFLGVDIKGGSQLAYRHAIDTNTLYDNAKILLDGSKIAKGKNIFLFTDSCYSSVVDSLAIINTATPLRVENSKTVFRNLNILGGDGNRDTAIVISNAENTKILDSYIGNYYMGVYIGGQSASNTVEKDSIYRVDIAVKLFGDTKSNTIRNNTFVYDSAGVHVVFAPAHNYIGKNIFGAYSHSARPNAVLIESSNSQDIVANEVYYAETIDDAALFVVTGSSRGTSFRENRIGLYKDNSYSKFVNTGAIWLRSEHADSVISNTVISSNEIVGSKNPIRINNAAGGSITGNMIGIDRGQKLRNDKDDFSEVPGISGVAIDIDSSVSISITGNMVVNYTGAALRATKSDMITMDKNILFSEKATDKKAIDFYVSDSLVRTNKGIDAPVVSGDLIQSINRVKMWGTAPANSKVQIYEAFGESEQSLVYFNTISVGADGKWEIILPIENFGFSKYNKFVTQATKDGRSSEFSSLYKLKTDLCSLNGQNINILERLYEPCPGSDFELDATLGGLNYEWIAKGNEFATITTQKARIEKSASMTLKLTGIGGCPHTEDFEVRYKPEPVMPDFLVTSNNFVGETIVAVAIIRDKGNSVFTWELSMNASSNDNMLIEKERSRIYSYTVNNFSFTAHEEDSIRIALISNKGECFKRIDKAIYVRHRNPNDEDPFSIASGINLIYVHPSPVAHGQDAWAYINLSSKEEAKLTVYSSLGAQVYEKLIAKDSGDLAELDIKHLNAGTYFLRVQTVYADLTYLFIVQ